MAIDLSSLWHWLYWLVALAASIFYGLKACALFEVDASNKPNAWWLHQFWFNFAGSAVGWLCAWPLVGVMASCATSGCAPNVTLSSVLLFLAAFLGVTGHLPMSIYGLIGGLKELAAKLISVAGGK